MPSSPLVCPLQTRRALKVAAAAASKTSRGRASGSRPWSGHAASSLCLLSSGTLRHRERTGGAGQETRLLPPWGGATTLSERLLRRGERQNALSARPFMQDLEPDAAQAQDGGCDGGCPSSTVLPAAAHQARRSASGGAFLLPRRALRTRRSAAGELKAAAACLTRCSGRLRGSPWARSRASTGGE